MKDEYKIEIVQEHRKDGKFRIVVKFEWVDTMKEMKDMMKFIRPCTCRLYDAPALSRFRIRLSFNTSIF